MIIEQTDLSANVTITVGGDDVTLKTVNFAGKSKVSFFITNTGSNPIEWRIVRYTGGVASAEEPSTLGNYNTLAASGVADWVVSDVSCSEIKLIARSTLGSTAKWMSSTEME